MANQLMTVEGLNVVAKYPLGKKILKDINFSINENSVAIFMGESGGGKTTLLRSLMGILPYPILKIESGIIKSAPLKKGMDISMVFQDASLYLNPVMKLGKQIEELFSAHKQRVDRGKIFSLMESLNLFDAEKMLGRYPHEISGGEQQRLLIVISLILDPKILIADEPSASLDHETALVVLNFLEEWRKKNKSSIIYSTHDLKTVKVISKGSVNCQLLVMKDGSIIERGAPNQMIDSPKEDYTRELLKWTL